MNSRDIRVARMKHQRDAGREKFAPLSQLDLFGELLRQDAFNGGEVDTGLLEKRAFFHYAGAPAPAPLTPPVVFGEARAAVSLFNRATDFVLKERKEFLRL